MRSKKPLILITNDDGYQAKGIVTLIETMRELGEVIVFAPHTHRSGMAGAISAEHAIRTWLHTKEEGFTMYVCNGTPADCVKLALNEFVDRKPDLLVSGINHGSNAAISVIYSGTVGAAVEGSLFDVPSIAYSLCDYHPDADFSEVVKVAHVVSRKVLEKGLPTGVSLNVNVPKGKVRGIKVATQTPGKWVNEYYRTKDGIGREVFWMTGQFDNWDKDNEDNDEWALANGYAAVVPVKTDMTAYDFYSRLKEWEL